ncbi:hypothetical protein [Carboxylicivirga taeanensis]|uniref:hypothetical protein n=1 Tax=Carboxylicivirga taeanensis TaxID=1416875 RepID=UPI003F6E41CC
MKLSKQLFVVISFLAMIGIYSCSTKLYLSGDKERVELNNILIIKNPNSYKMGLGKCPKYEYVDRYVRDTIPAKRPIADLLSKELLKYGIESKIIETIPEDYNSKTQTIISYKDYWTNDFKNYMHILVMTIKTNSKEFKIISEGNTKGFHNYPNPEKQIPIMIKKIIESQEITVHNTPL